MANALTNRGLTVLMNPTTVLRAMIERSTSTYSFDPDHDYLSDLSSFVEISSASYTRQTLGSFSFTPVDGSDHALLGFATIDFGTPASGQIMKALMLYAQVGGDDTTPEDDIFVARLDTFTNPSLPREISGVGTSFTLPSGLIIVKQAA